MELETLTLQQLQDKLVELGMPSEDAQTVKTKASAIAFVKTLMAKDAVAQVDQEEPGEPTEPVKKVASIEEKPNAAEDREVNRRWKNKAEKMREHLLSQPTVNILIPLDPGEKPGVVEWRTDKQGNKYQVKISGAVVDDINLNGFKYLVPKGRYYPVPKQIADELSQSLNQTLSAGQDISLDRIDPKTGKPMSEILG